MQSAECKRSSVSGTIADVPDAKKRMKLLHTFFYAQAVGPIKNGGAGYKS